MQCDLQFIRRALPDAVVSGDVPSDLSFSIDSRTIKPGEIFVAMPGSKVDGHTFIKDAIKRGAGGVVVEAKRSAVIDDLTAKKLLVISVENSRAALIGLARVWRQQFSCPVVAITGSVGKTSTRLVLNNILRAAGYEFATSEGNQNTLIGVALTICRMRRDHDAAIFEVGVSKRGEMSAIVDLLRPTTAAITNAGHQHMDGLGSVADIAIEKRKVFECFGADSIGVVNGDQVALAAIAYRHPVVKFGAKTTNQVQVRRLRMEGGHINFVMRLYKDDYTIALDGFHGGIIYNVLAAASLAHLLDVPHDIIAKGVRERAVVPGRFEQRELANGQGIIINDTYNASPESVKEALAAFARLEVSSQKIVVLGDMCGLGANGPFWHRQIGRFLGKLPLVERVILVGNLVQWTQKTAPVGGCVDRVSSWHEALEILKQELVRQKAAVLVSGSRAMGLANLVDACTADSYTRASQKGGRRYVQQ